MFWDLKLHDISDLAAKTDFKVFTGALGKERGVVKVICVPGGAEKLTRKITDGYSEWVKMFGAGGVPTTKVGADGSLEAGIGKFIDSIAKDLVERVGAKPGDQLFFGADTYATCSKALGELRQKIARDMGMIDESKWAFVWVEDFPMFEYDEETKRFYAMHHPFTAPNPDQVEAFLAADPDDRETIEGIVSAGYDLVCRPRCSNCSAYRLRKRRRSSASSWMRCSSAPHLTAASRLVSTDSSCTWRARTTSAT